MERRRRSRRKSTPDPSKFAHLPDSENPYAPKDVGPLSEVGRAKNRGKEDPSDPFVKKVRAKASGTQTARELGKLGSIAGSKIGGQVSRAKVELSKKALRDKQLEDIDARIARDEAQPE